MSSNTLVVNFQFNPPKIQVVGPVKESTIEKLNTVLPSVTSSRRGDRAGQPKFVYKPLPSHWAVTLDGQFCDQIGESRVCLAILDALEDEGSWKLKSTQAVTLQDTDSLQQSYFNSYTFFFKRIL
jgi:hypothetical protein